MRGRRLELVLWTAWMRARGPLLRGALALLLVLALAHGVAPSSTRTSGPAAVPRQVPAVDWRPWRGALERAHSLRRTGDDAGAIDAYDAVAGAASARGRDAERARLWAARLRLERGEWSASSVLFELASRCEDPALLAFIVRTARVRSNDSTPTSWSERMERVVRVATDRLREMTLRRTELGARARRWVAQLERSAR